MALRLCEPTQTPYQELRRWPLRELLMANVRHCYNEQQRHEARERAMRDA